MKLSGSSLPRFLIHILPLLYVVNLCSSNKEVSFQIEGNNGSVCDTTYSTNSAFTIIYKPENRSLYSTSGRNVHMLVTYDVRTSLRYEWREETLYQTNHKTVSQNYLLKWSSTEQFYYRFVSKHQLIRQQTISYSIVIWDFSRYWTVKYNKSSTVDLESDVVCPKVLNLRVPLTTPTTPTTTPTTTPETSRKRTRATGWTTYRSTTTRTTYRRTATPSSYRRQTGYRRTTERPTPRRTTPRRTIDKPGVLASICVFTTVGAIGLLFAMSFLWVHYVDWQRKQRDRAQTEESDPEIELMVRVGTTQEDRIDMVGVGTPQEDRIGLVRVGTPQADRIDMVGVGTPQADRIDMVGVGTPQEDRIDMIGVVRSEISENRREGADNREPEVIPEETEVENEMRRGLMENTETTRRVLIENERRERRVMRELEIWHRASPGTYAEQIQAVAELAQRELEPPTYSELTETSLTNARSEILLASDVSSNTASDVSSNTVHCDYIADSRFEEHSLSGDVTAQNEVREEELPSYEEAVRLM